MYIVVTYLVIHDLKAGQVCAPMRRAQLIEIARVDESVGDSLRLVRRYRENSVCDMKESMVWLLLMVNFHNYVET